MHRREARGRGLSQEAGFSCTSLLLLESPRAAGGPNGMGVCRGALLQVLDTMGNLLNGQEIGIDRQT